MKSKRPYLIRALLEWINDSGNTPYLLVSVDSDRVQVPLEYVHEGKIVLNISSGAVRHLQISEDEVSFDGRFSGRPFWVEFPVSHVLAIYAKESGDGMVFDAPEAEDPAASVDDVLPDSTNQESGVPTGDKQHSVDSASKKGATVSHLRVIK